MNTVFNNYLFDAFANSSESIFVYVTDIETGITRWSARAVEYFNLENEYLENVKDMWLSYIHYKDHDVYLKDIEAVFAGKSTNHHCQYRVRNRYGEYVWVECHGSIIYDDFGNPKVFAGIMSRLDNPNKYDSLTHLLSGYELFRQPLKPGGVMMIIGVDRLRDINSQHGVLYGNRVIQYLADALARYASGSLIFRYWGDDFIVYDHNASKQEMMNLFRIVAEKCSNMNDTADLAGFSVSAGITSNGNDCSQTELIGQVELAMAYAKKQASHVVVFSDSLKNRKIRKMAIGEALMESVRNHFRGFYLVFQPIISNDRKSIRACEALLRWDSSDEFIGSCGPDEFIPILEENRGIIDVGYFVMREAIKQAAIWQKKSPGLKVSINASYYQMEDLDFAKTVVEEIQKNYLNPACVVIELTESVLINDTLRIRKSFEYLKENGVLVALDDFGRGNSSFWMLHNLHVDYIKLDQSFIRNLNKTGDDIDNAIVRSTILLCESIGSGAIAEGIEDEGVYDKIRDFGFDALQGYLFSKPLLPLDFEDFLELHQ